MSVRPARIAPCVTSANSSNVAKLQKISLSQKFIKQKTRLISFMMAFRRKPLAKSAEGVGAVRNLYTFSNAVYNLHN